MYKTQVECCTRHKVTVVQDTLYVLHKDYKASSVRKTYEALLEDALNAGKALDYISLLYQIEVYLIEKGLNFAGSRDCIVEEEKKKKV